MTTTHTTTKQHIDERAAQRLVTSSRHMHTRAPHIPTETFIRESNMPRNVIRRALALNAA